MIFWTPKLQRPKGLSQSLRHVHFPEHVQTHTIPGTNFQGELYETEPTPPPGARGMTRLDLLLTTVRTALEFDIAGNALWCMNANDGKTVDVQLDDIKNGKITMYGGRYVSGFTFGKIFITNVAGAGTLSLMVIQT